MNIFTIFMLLSFSQTIVTKAERITDVLDSLNASVELIEESPKVWQAYVKYILFRIIKKTLRHHCHRYVLFLQKPLRSMIMFYKYEFLQTYENFAPKKCNYSQLYDVLDDLGIGKLNVTPSVCFNQTRENSSTVLAPTGKLVSFYQNSFDCDVTDKYVKLTSTALQVDIIDN